MEKDKRKSGFTLVETIVMFAVVIIIVTTIISVVVSGLKDIRTIRHLGRLHSNAIFLSNTLAYWVKQGENLDVTSPSTLAVKLSDSSIKEIKQDGNNIKIDGSPFNTDDIQVTNLTFHQLARSVQVSFTLQAEDNEELHIQTTIAQRNNL